jgi:hypothetical protein
MLETVKPSHPHGPGPRSDRAGYSRASSAQQPNHGGRPRKLLGSGAPSGIGDLSIIDIADSEILISRLMSW